MTEKQQELIKGLSSIPIEAQAEIFNGVDLETKQAIISFLSPKVVIDNFDALPMEEKKVLAPLLNEQTKAALVKDYNIIPKSEYQVDPLLMEKVIANPMSMDSLKLGLEGLAQVAPRVLDYPSGLVRTGITQLAGKGSPGDWRNALLGNPMPGTVLNQRVFGADPNTLKGKALGFGTEMITDPLALGGGAKAFGKAVGKGYRAIHKAIPYAGAPGGFMARVIEGATDPARVIREQSARVYQTTMPDVVNEYNKKHFHGDLLKEQEASEGLIDLGLTGSNRSNVLKVVDLSKENLALIQSLSAELSSRGATVNAKKLLGAVETSINSSKRLSPEQKRESIANLKDAYLNVSKEAPGNQLSLNLNPVSNPPAPSSITKKELLLAAKDQKLDSETIEKLKETLEKASRGEQLSVDEVSDLKYFFRENFNIDRADTFLTPSAKSEATSYSNLNKIMSDELKSELLKTAVPSGVGPAKLPPFMKKPLTPEESVKMVDDYTKANKQQAELIDIGGALRDKYEGTSAPIVTPEGPTKVAKRLATSNFMSSGKSGVEASIPKDTWHSIARYMSGSTNEAMRNKAIGKLTDEFVRRGAIKGSELGSRDRTNPWTSQAEDYRRKAREAEDMLEALQ